MEIGENYKIVYKDGNYSKIASGTISSVDLHMIWINDKIEGEIGIGKHSIVKIGKIGIRDENVART